MKQFGLQKMILMTAVLVSASACSMKDRTEVHAVRVQLPSEWQNKTTVNSSSFLVSDPILGGVSIDPIVTSYNCYALSVTGPGILMDSRLSCSDPADGIGISAGFVPVTQGTIELMVPAGGERKVQLVGIYSSSGVCPTMEEVFSNNIDIQPYLLGETTTDVFDDTAVSIYADLASSTAAFSSCGGGGGSGGMSGGVPTLQFDIVNNSAYIQAGSCTSIGIYASGMAMNSIFPSVWPKISSAGGNAKFYSDNNCSTEFEITGYMSTNFYGNYLGIYVKSPEAFTAEIQTTATGWALQSPVNFTIVEDSVIASPTPSQSAQVNSCIPVNLSSSMGLPLGALMLQLKSASSGTGIINTQIYNDMDCLSTPIALTAENTYTMNLTDFPGVETPYVSFYLKSSVEERVSIGISRPSNPLQPLGLSIEFKPFSLYYPSFLSGDYLTTHQLHLAINTMSVGYSITSVSIGGLDCPIDTSTTTSADLYCTVPSNANPSVTLGRKPIYLSMLNSATGVSNDYYSGFDWEFGTIPSIAAGQVFNLNLNSSVTSAFVNIINGGDYYSCGGALPPGLSFSSGCQIMGTPSSYGEYVASVLVSNSIGTSNYQDIVINVLAQPMFNNGISSYYSISGYISCDGSYNCTFDGPGSRYIVAKSIATTMTPSMSGSIPDGCSANMLPPGLSIGSDCKITGTPTTNGTFDVQISATKAGFSPANLMITIVVQ